MRRLLLIAFVFFTMSACAQISESDLQKRIQNSSVIKMPGMQLSPVAPRADNDSLLALMKQMVEARVNSANKSAIKYLSPDNMPCLVPEMKTVEAMPNAWPKKDVIVEPMPNPGKKKSGASSR